MQEERQDGASPKDKPLMPAVYVQLN